jgi:A/G-specific adenine glycosylase
LSRANAPDRGRSAAAAEGTEAAASAAAVGSAGVSLPRHFGSRVVAWQRQSGRQGLPWQGTRDPYRVWLSEVMLQQTQVATVLDYYPRFLARFPDVATLAAAALDDVLALWSGLGYYSRARNLHRCARAVVAQHGGRFPGSAAGLAALPGIGPSTAAAIAAFCFGERAAILDGNVKRVMTRALGFGDDLAQSASQRRLWLLAEQLLPTEDVDTYTQGLMDLGATVCTLRRPACSVCPLGADCAARAAGQPEAYPVKTRRLRRGRRSHALLWLHRPSGADREHWLVQRPPRGVWAGLWSLPEFADAANAQAAMAGRAGQGTWLPPLQHALTHFDWTLQVLRWQCPPVLDEREAAGARTGASAVGIEPSGQPGRWFKTAQALALGLPAPVRKLFETER